MKKLKRIVTYFDAVAKKRYFTVGKVIYDSTLTPLYFDIPQRGLEVFESLEELKAKYPTLDCPVLDLDKSYQIWDGLL